MHRQLITELAPEQGRRALVISAAKEIEPGARAMLVLADGLFRLDVRIVGDSLQTFLRNFAGSPLQIDGSAGAPGDTILAGEAGRYAPGRADLRFSLGAGPERLVARVTIGTLRLAQRGTVRVSAHAVIGQAQA